MKKNNYFKIKKVIEEKRIIPKLLNHKNLCNNDVEKIKQNNNNNFYIIKNQIKNITNKKILIFIIIIICLILPIKSQNDLYNHRILQAEELNIINTIINVSERGEQEIFYSNYIYKPVYIYVNGSIMNINENNTILLEKNIYSIKLIWNYTINKFDYIFCGLVNIIEIDFSDFNTSQINSMKSAFKDCINLKKINFGNNFDTSSTRSMHYMFFNCTSLISLNLSSFITSNVNEIECMFYYCSSLEYLDVSNFNTSIIQSFSQMFRNCKSLKSLDLHSFNTEIVENMNEMFANCISLTSLDISSFNTKSVLKMNKMFMNCNLLTSLDLSGFDTSLVTKMECFFEGCKNLISIDVSKFNTSSCQSMRRMFVSCELITSLNLSNFDTKNVTNMNEMFMKCYSLISLNLLNFNTSKVNSFFNMFDSCKSLISLDISNFNTNQVTNYTSMFESCESLISIDLSSFNTDKAITFENMFNNCNELTSIDLSNFNTSSTVIMKSMFRNCKQLTSLNLSNFNTLLVQDMTTMFEGCRKLEYINIKNFNEYNSVITTNMFTKTPDNLIYCLNNEDLTPNIKSELLKKDCQIKDCDYFWKENYENMIIYKKNDINSIHDKCIIKDIKQISKYFYFSSNFSNISIYSYEIGSLNELTVKNSNLTFIDISEDQKKYLLNIFNINENETLYIFIYDAPSNDSRTATSDYNFELILENGTKLDLSELEEDFYVNITVPIRDLDLANFNYVELFSENGYDIYNINSNFYNDVCSPAYINDNDITLEDRKKDIYPNNVTLCKENCEYKGVNIEEKKIICECNLNINNVYQNENDEDDILDEEDDNNYISYFLDNINYKIFKCYPLLLSFDNLIKNPSFYIILIFTSIIMFFSFKFLFIGVAKLRILMYKELPTEHKVRCLIIEHLKKIKFNNCINENQNVYKESSRDKNDQSDAVRIIQSKRNTKFKSIKKNKSNSISFLNKKYSKRSTKQINSLFNNKKIKFSPNKNINRIKRQTIHKMESINIINNENKNSYNFSPYTKAIREDKRNIFQILKSLIFEKIDLLNLFYSDEIYKELLINQYILSLLLDFFFNVLLYSDDVVSHKYHNDGKLDYIVTISISMVSNVISSLFSHFLEFSDKLGERLEQIGEIRQEYKYLYAFKKLLKYIKIRMIFFIIIEIIILVLSFYYITIFFIVYSKCHKSLSINYITSLSEGLLKSIIIIILIVATRKIGIEYRNKYIFNTSLYIDKKF